ncbi:MAG TPA: glycerophosphodiester phosphodiesterase [Longimicrobiaceae bacterium]|nr:glycerophosphodiester phosphodiesterase [Longimicrobiaceae bacterium]
MRLSPRRSSLPRARPGHPYFAGAPLLMAHRGGSALAPENTLAAFRRAVEWWRADVLETDVQPTADGEVVVIHDATVDRTTDGSGPVAGLRLEEIRRLDAGYRFSPDGGRTFPFRGGGVRISTLEEVLLALPETRINVEIKDGRAQRRVLETVHDLGATRRVLIAAGRRANRSRFAAYPGPTSAAQEDVLAFWLHLRSRTVALYRPPVDAFQVPERHGAVQVVTPRFVREAHALNIPVHVWTVDDEPEMRRLLEWGVDGIVTDRPDRLARVLHERLGRPLPPGPPGGA